MHERGRPSIREGSEKGQRNKESRNYFPAGASHRRPRDFCWYRSRIPKFQPFNFRWYDNSRQYFKRVWGSDHHQHRRHHHQHHRQHHHQRQRQHQHQTHTGLGVALGVAFRSSALSLSLSLSHSLSLSLSLMLAHTHTGECSLISARELLRLHRALFARIVAAALVCSRFFSVASLIFH
jgi:cation transport ATPase